MKSLPKLKFAHLPTPVEALPRLGAALGGRALFVKRDDQTGLALGGNKTRKLEYLLAEAQANGAQMILTAGAVQSNHCRQTAAAAARLGFDCTLVLAGAEPAQISGNVLLDRLFGARLVFVERDQREAALQAAFERAWEGGQRPYLVPYGGSSPVGAAAYFFAFTELLAQFDPDWIIFASSSGGTQAGLALSSAYSNWRGKLLGISVDEPADVLQERVADLANRTAELLDLPQRLAPTDILVNADYLGAGYGVLGEPEREAIHLFARHEGLLLDPVYTGRAAAGLIDLARTGFFKPGEKILFWHTGGAPAIFAEQYTSLGE